MSVARSRVTFEKRPQERRAWEVDEVPVAAELPAWFQEALAADAAGRHAAAIDRLYANIDGLLRNREFPAVDGVLRAVSPDEPSTTFLVALLSITLPASPHLNWRRQLFNSMWRRLERSGRNAEKLLGGLKQWSRMDGTSPRGER
jgi:hypothetical protein